MIASSLLRKSCPFPSCRTMSSLWANIPLAPADKILGLNEEFAKNPSPTKVNLGVGAYRDDKGKPYILPSVRAARIKLEAKNPDHEYAGIAGLAPFVKHSLEFAYGEDADVLKSGRVAAVQTLSGTGACRLVGEFIAKFMGKGKDMYLPDPTWGNHIPIMKNSGLEVPKYRYFDPKTKGFNFDGMLADVLGAKNNSAFLVHACAHNPTGNLLLLFYPLNIIIFLPIVSHILYNYVVVDRM